MIYLYVIVGMCSSFLLSLALLLFYLRYKRNILQQQFQIQLNELEYQKKLTQVIITSQEQERKRIGKELHDDVGNSLAALRLYLDKYMYLPESNNVTIREEYNKRIGSIFNKLRTISHQLSVSEIELFGLKEAIFMLCDHIEQSDKFVINIDESQHEIPENLEYNTSVMIYRVFQELLTNTIKHADANEVTISFEHQAISGNMMIRYSDNGKGLDADTAHQGFGFKNIESRLQAVNGYYEIDHATGPGFSIKIFIPQDQLITVPVSQAKSLQS
jgi:signal transduction histidine kinase